MGEPKNGSGRWPIPLVLQIGAIIFAAGGGWMMLKAQAECNEKQEAKLEANDTEHVELKEMQARIDERLKRMDEKLGDIKSVLEMYRLPQ